MSDTVSYECIGGPRDGERVEVPADHYMQINLVTPEHAKANYSAPVDGQGWYALERHPISGKRSLIWRLPLETRGLVALCAFCGQPWSLFHDCPESHPE